MWFSNDRLETQYRIIAQKFNYNYFFYNTFSKIEKKIMNTVIKKVIRVIVSEMDVRSEFGKSYFERVLLFE